MRLLATAEEGWKKRVNETSTKDASRFTVAGKMGKKLPDFDPCDPEVNVPITPKKITPKPIAFLATNGKIPKRSLTRKNQISLKSAEGR